MTSTEAEFWDRGGLLENREEDLMGTDVTGTELAWIEAIAQSLEPHAFTAFHLTTLPAMAARHGHLVRDDLRGAEPLTFRVPDGAAFTWKASPEGVRVEEGECVDGTVIELSERTFSEFLDQL